MTLPPRPEKDKLPLEVNPCYMEIYRKEQNLTPLLNSIRNEVVAESTARVDAIVEWLEKFNIMYDGEDIRQFIKEIQGKKSVSDLTPNEELK